MRTTIIGPVLALTALFPVQLSAQDERAARPEFAPDGVVRVPAFELPPSEMLSPEAVAMLKARSAKGPPPQRSTDIGELRRNMDNHLTGVVAAMRQRFPVNMEEQRIAGIRTWVFTPRDGVADRKRVLINVHGGGFQMCANSCSLLESAPLAAQGKFRVVSIDYRMGPEAVFPAASEDVAAVYRELLKTYKPKNIGLYGCSAGGVLTAQATAWFGAHNMPVPGAIGIFGAGAGQFGFGDSGQISARIDGSFPAPPRAGETPAPPPFRSYFEGSDSRGRLVSPVLFPDELAKFPPTLLITGTRAIDLSAAAFTHSQLIKAGVPGDLIVGEGMGHCYIYYADLPEARDAISASVDFFRKNLR